MNGYNAVQVQINLAKYPPKTAKILHQDIFWFFLQDDFMSRTITEGSDDLDKFPASRVRQLMKKLVSAKATACHIMQVAGDPQVTQINLLWHQRTELPITRHNKKRRPVNKQRQTHHKIPENQMTGQVKKHYHNRTVHKSKDRCNRCGNSTHIKGFHCPAKNYQCKVCHKYGHFFKFLLPNEEPSSPQEQYKAPRGTPTESGPSVCTWQLLLQPLWWIELQGVLLPTATSTVQLGWG